MNDALRYQTNEKKKRKINGKSGEPAPDPNSSSDEEDTNESKEESSIESWPLWDTMKFMVDSKVKRK